MRPNDLAPPSHGGEAHDVIVVGASAAGAATAMLLARGGLDTLVIDDRSGDAHPPPTDALLRGGVLQLSRWGLLEDIVAAATPAVKRTTLRYANEVTVITLRPSNGVDALYAPRAKVIEPLLLHAAEKAGAEVRQDLSVVDLVTKRNRVGGVHATVSGGGVTELEATLVIGADGLDSTIARCAGAGDTRLGRHVGAMTYGYWSDLPVDGFEWVFEPDACSGFIPTNDDEVFVFASASPNRIGDGGIRVIRDIVHEGAPALAARLQDATEPLETRVWHGHRGFIRRSQGPGWALVGEAGYFQDPVSVHGLTDALRDAELLAHAVLDAHGDAASVDAALEQYESTRDRLSIPCFDVVDRIASHQWDGAEMANLQVQLSSTMTNEVEMLAALEPESVA
jgi:flavin-dependent dehydrogenase